MSTSNPKAGGHGDVVTTFVVNQLSQATPDGTARKDIVVDLPPGFVGNPRAVPTCEIARVRMAATPGEGLSGGAALVGYIETEAAFPAFGAISNVLNKAPIYNIVPNKGQPAAFAFAIYFNTVRLDASVRSDGDYGIRIAAKNLSERLYLLSSRVTFWGVPGDHTGPGEQSSTTTRARRSEGSGGDLRIPFLSNPTRCDSEPMSAIMSLASWQAPRDVVGGTGS